ncbi:DUF3097 family protein [Agrococcus casei]|uniref:DUF3097 family protein n=1 Tax=Agrococcus casei TaxID=343512 RepID=UPI001F38B1EF
MSAVRGLVLEHGDGYVGEIVDVASDSVGLEDRRGKVRRFPYGRGLYFEGVEIELVKASQSRPATAARDDRSRSASGSRAAADARARTALPSRIFVEGRHDAELVEKVWGHDLRVEGVVVEYLGGIDDLTDIVADFAPTAERRLGVLVDHLVPGSKESRIADQVARTPAGRFVHVVGHPYIDIWQAIKPQSLGIRAWPDVPRGEDFKHGTLKRLGLPHGTQEDVAKAWQAMLARVRSWNDLEPALLGRVEELIDFVTVHGER